MAHNTRRNYVKPAMPFAEAQKLLGRADRSEYWDEDWQEHLVRCVEWTHGRYSEVVAEGEVGRGRINALGERVDDWVLVKERRHYRQTHFEGDEARELLNCGNK